MHIIHYFVTAARGGDMSEWVILFYVGFLCYTILAVWREGDEWVNKSTDALTVSIDLLQQPGRERGVNG